MFPSCLAGSSRHFYCVEAYDLGGTVLSVNGTYNFTTASTQETATYCAEYCAAVSTLFTQTGMQIKMAFKVN